MYEAATNLSLDKGKTIQMYMDTRFRHPLVSQKQLHDLSEIKKLVILNHKGDANAISDNY